MGKSVRKRVKRPARAKEMAQAEAKSQRHAHILREAPPNRRIAITKPLETHFPVTCADSP
jgi:hypothetical protein